MTGPSCHRSVVRRDNWSKVFSRFPGVWILLIAGSAVFGTGCRSRAAVVAPPAAIVSPTMDVLYQDDAGAVRDSSMWAVSDSAELATQWKRVTAASLSPPPVPAVNFRREMLLFVAAGPRKAGDRIHVDSTRVVGEALHAFVTITEACPRMPVNVYPLEVVKVTPTRRRVEFRVSSVLGKCPPESVRSR